MLEKSLKIISREQKLNFLSEIQSFGFSYIEKLSIKMGRPTAHQDRAANIQNQ